MFRTGVLGQKIGMTSVFTANGDRAPVTAILAGPCVVLDKLTKEKNGYSAVRLGFGEKPVKVAAKSELGIAKKAGIEVRTVQKNKHPRQLLDSVRFIREVRLEDGDLEKYEVGKPVALSQLFKALSYVDVEGTSKGKGYQGVMKRHHMAGFRNTHGTHEFFRHGGSVGCRLTPGRVHKGKRMSGHMGDDKRSVQNLVLLEIDEPNNVLLVRGSVPGAKNQMVVIRNSKKRFGQPVKLRSDVEAQEKSKNPMKASKAGGTTAAKKPAAAAKPAKK
jgi:large subunit ribosomal protein L3